MGASSLSVDGLSCSLFMQVKVLDGSVVWPHEQDICPDTLYLDSVTLAKKYIAKDEV